MSKKLQIGVFGIWRNSEAWADRTLNQLDDLIEKFPDCHFSFFFYENDSTDNTVEILKNWAKQSDAKVLSETLNTKQYGSVMNFDRMKLLAQYRNKCKSLAKDKTFDFALVIDTDIQFNHENLSYALEFLTSKKEYVMATPNVRQPIEDFVFKGTNDSYYDVGCLRDRYGNETLFSSNCPFKRIDDRMLWNLNLPVEINAGFGGFALIKWVPFSSVKWSADINIEHVNFCYDLKEYGKIACLPYSKVYVELNDDTRDVVKNNRSFLENQIYEV